jgi:hypothetical protein
MGAMLQRRQLHNLLRQHLPRERLQTALLPQRLASAILTSLPLPQSGKGQLQGLCLGMQLPKQWQRFLRPDLLLFLCQAQAAAAAECSDRRQLAAMQQAAGSRHLCSAAQTWRAACKLPRLGLRANGMSTVLSSSHHSRLHPAQRCHFENGSLCNSRLWHPAS